MLYIFNVKLLYFMDQVTDQRVLSVFVLTLHCTEFPFIVSLITAALLRKNADVLDIFNSWGAQDNSKLVTVINT